MKLVKSLGMALACGGLLAACQDLDVTNVNNPPLEETLATPINVETTVASAIRQFFSQTVDSDYRQEVTWMTPSLDAAADAAVQSSTSFAYVTAGVSTEPRTEMVHTDAGFWVNRTAWLNFYAAAASCIDIIHTLDAGMKLGTVSNEFPNGQHTDRARWMCHFIIGASHGYLAALYDRVLIIDPAVERPDIYAADFVTPDSAMKYALFQIEKGITLAKAAPDDQTSLLWFNQQAYTRDEMVQMMYSYMARLRPAVARNPTERAAVDWARVIADANLGIDDAFHPVSGSPLPGRSIICPTTPNPACGGALVYQANRTENGMWQPHRWHWSRGTGSTVLRPSQRLLGPGDTTGAYQCWEAPGSPSLTGGTCWAARRDTTYGSPDRRIHGSTGATSAGRYFVRTTTSSSVTLGPQNWSKYTFQRWGTNGTNAFQDSLNMYMAATEMDQLRAEGYIRTGQPALAVPLINKTRQYTLGANLPPVTVAGPTGAGQPFATSRSCVPKRVDGTCGDLMDALMYEKRLEQAGSYDVSVLFTDWRGWGKMAQGQWIHLPVHSRELFTLGVPYYTFGGSQPGGTIGVP
jgi:hypothetical protein